MGLFKHPTAAELEEKFNRIYEENEEKVFCLALRLTGNQDAAEDIRQETFLALHAKLGRLLNHPDLEGWLYKAAYHFVQHYWRENKNKAQREEPFDEIAEQIPAPPSSGSEKEFIDLLPIWVNSTDAKLLVLYYYYGYSLRDIAERTGISYAGVRDRLARLRQKLREYGFGKLD